MTKLGNSWQPRPLPMPEYGGWFAPLTEFLPEASVPISNFHRCNLALILLTDLVVDGLDLDCHSVDWSVHMPLMLHIIFLGLDNNKEMIYRHCHQLLLNLLIVLGQHSDHLTVSSILMNGQIEQVWPLTQFFLLPFCENSLICLEDKPMTPHRGNTLLFRSFQQLPDLHLGPLKGFLSAEIPGHSQEQLTQTLIVMFVENALFCCSKYWGDRAPLVGEPYK